jgi:hypothetical protein
MPKDRVRLIQPEQNTVPRKHRGAHAEMIAACWLMEHGWDVFRNLSPHGPVDLVAIKGDQVRLFDVKLCNFRPRETGGWQVAGPVLKWSQAALGVEPIFVTPDGLCAFDRRAFEALCEGLLD